MTHNKKDRIKVGVMDADLLERKNHRFPNLACEKISQYYKDVHNAEVTLLLDYDSFGNFDKVFISKVFTNTPIPDWILDYVDGEYPGAHYEGIPPIWQIKGKRPEIHVGGTGFYFDNAPDLPAEIEHHMPDYHLYDAWINKVVSSAEAECKACGKTFNKPRFMLQFKEYLEYSIGFVTRGCFRKCGFCVNKKYDCAFPASALSEFYDPSRKKICLLDDNFLSYGGWREILSDITKTGRQYKFKQGLDERLLTDEKCKLLFTSQYDGDLTFAFDNVTDYELIHKQLRMIRKNNPTKGVMFYVLVGFESTDAVDIENAFKRIELLFQYGCLPYIMRYVSESGAPWEKSEMRGMYITLARWCNQPSLAKKMSFRDFCVASQKLHKNPDTYCAPYKAMVEFEEKYPEIAEKYFDIRFNKDKGYLGGKLI